MSGIYYDLAEILVGAGCRFAQNSITDGWQTRARSSGGFSAPPLAVFWHHTASATSPENDLAFMIDGSDDAPVGNLLLDRDGVFWPVAAGASNCAGKGGPVACSRGTIPLDQGNTHGFQIEAANNGVGEPWPQAQIDAYFAGSNALNVYVGNQPEDVITHALGSGDGWTDRKIDPATAAAIHGPWRPGSVTTSGTWSLADIRAECRRRNQPQEDDMIAATLWRPQGYLNWFLIGAGSTVTVSPEVFDSLVARGVPQIVEAHGQMLETVLFQTGLELDDLVPGGG